jgi:nucleoside-diphosphate-sugar epimerase
MGVVHQTMRVVVTGATGNHGTSLVRHLAADPAVTAITGIARRRPALTVPKTEFVTRDITKDPLEDLLRGADAVVHLAWLIQPMRDERVTHATNVVGSQRVFEAAARAAVPALVHASSVGAYSPGPKDRTVDESFPTDGIPSSYYSRHKAAVERILDSFEAAHPEMRVVRVRPGLVFKREAGTQIRRLFAGPLLPNPLVRRALVPLVPAPERLRFQAVHTEDLAEAYRLCVRDEDFRGPVNVAADPVLDPASLGGALGARPVPVPGAVLRGLADLTFRLRVQPTEPGWLDLALGVPLMDVTRARTELGWTPRFTALDAFNALFDGIRDGAGDATPPLSPRTSGPLRVREVLTGVGGASK